MGNVMEQHKCGNPFHTKHGHTPGFVWGLLQTNVENRVVHDDLLDVEASHKPCCVATLRVQRNTPNASVENKVVHDDLLDTELALGV